MSDGGAAGGRQELVERARTLRAGAHVDERLTLARFAAAAGCTPFRLCHAVRAVTGGTLHAWLCGCGCSSRSSGWPSRAAT